MGVYSPNGKFDWSRAFAPPDGTNARNSVTDYAVRAQYEYWTRHNGFEPSDDAIDLPPSEYSEES